MGGSDDITGFCEIDFAASIFGQPKISNPDLAFLIEDNILGFDVPVKEVGIVSKGDRIGDVCGDSCRPAVVVGFLDRASLRVGS